MFRKGKRVVEGDPKKSWSGIEMEGWLNKRSWGPLKRRRPYICLDGVEDTSTQISTPIESDLLVWPSPQ